MQKALLKVRNLKKYFPVYRGLFRKIEGHVKAVDDVSFDIYPGEILGMVGESGCGKSTLCRAAIRLTEPTSGEIEFLGRDFLSLSKTELKEERKEIQMVFQDPFASLNPRKKIGTSIGEALMYHKLVSSLKEQEARVIEILRQIGLSPDVMYRYPHEFSGGQQQRICIGRAIAMHPKLVICDEAVSALDVSIQAQILNLLMELKEKLHLSYLFVSHDLSVIRYICDRVIVMYQGREVESGPVEEIFTHPQHPYTRTLLSAIPCSFPKRKSS